ncbi:hypothetical protein [Defluviimonas salinarum]|uniref:Lipoprotein n=1 Tax=Defluviimonas salinarum TaxID=2992147 RepID=A0ABT3J139_9RHOB|nr:hypothetical protein [Defluviimonas salinarum]MCW3781380.1 hypothetical protein [Defluviimonas salinarum]
MKLKLAACFAVIAVAGCQPTSQSEYWKDGGSVARRQNDYTNCEVDAVNKVPTAMKVGTTPTYTTPTYVTPSSTSCYGYGYSVNCYTTGGNVTGGQTYGGQVYSYDANLDLRKRVFGQCMANAGYTQITVPTCTKEQEKLGVVVGPGTQSLPKAADVLCGTSTGYVLKPEA